MNATKAMHATGSDLRAGSDSDRPLRRNVHLADRRRPGRRRAAGAAGPHRTRTRVGEDVILGHCYPNSEAPAIGRVVALDAGLPVTVPGMQVDRRCGSGLQAVIQACLQVASGDNDLVVAGGAETMSNVAFHSTDMRWGGARAGSTCTTALARGPQHRGRACTIPVPGGMLETAENLRREYGISRAEQDELAVASHQRAVAAQKNGILAEEIIPVTVRSRHGEELIDTDEHPARRHDCRGAEQAQPVLLVRGSGSHRHRRELERTERRGVHVHRHHARRRPPNSG